MNRSSVLILAPSSRLTTVSKVVLFGSVGVFLFVDGDGFDGDVIVVDSDGFDCEVRVAQL